MITIGYDDDDGHPVISAGAAHVNIATRADADAVVRALSDWLARLCDECGGHHPPLDDLDTPAARGEADCDTCEKRVRGSPEDAVCCPECGRHPVRTTP